MAKDEVNETTDDRRYFDIEIDGKETRFYLRVPSAEQIRKSEWHYAKVYNRALVEGIATNAEMVGILTKRGIYGPAFEERLKEIQVDLTTKLIEASTETDRTKKRLLAEEAASLRNDLFQWNQRITGPLNNCCEQMADDAKVEYLTSTMVVDANDKPLWDSYDIFIVEKNQNLALLARYEVLLMFQGLDSNFMDVFPETQMLAKMEEEDAAGPKQLEASVEEVVSENVATPKKKRATRGKARKKNLAAK